jgi:hypothetical protein
MADRKTIQKYYPANFDPSKIIRNRSTVSKRNPVVNFACPFRSIRRIFCSAYTTKGTVFRSTPKHISEEIYLGVKSVRLHPNCPHCRTEIIIETDPKNMDYRIVSGAKRGYEAWRDGERAGGTEDKRLDRLKHEIREGGMKTRWVRLR